MKLVLPSFPRSPCVSLSFRCIPQCLLRYGGELSGGVLSRLGILERSTKGMNSKREESSLVGIALAYKISALTPIFSIRLHVHTGPGNRTDNLE